MVVVSNAAIEEREAFMEGLRRRYDSVHAVTYRREDGRLSGLTATSVVSVSVEPPTLLVCVNRSARSHGALIGAHEVGINLLSAQQQPLAERLSTNGADKAIDESEIATGNGLADACVSMSCHVVAAHDHATHTVLVLAVLRTRLGPGRAPLVYHDRQFINEQGEHNE